MGTARALGCVTLVSSVAVNVAVVANAVGRYRPLTAAARAEINELASMPRVLEIPATMRVLGPYIDLNVGHVAQLAADGLLVGSSDPTSVTARTIQAEYFVRAEPAHVGDRPVALGADGDVTFGPTADGCVMVTSAAERATISLGPSDGSARSFSIPDGRQQLEVRAVVDGDRSVAVGLPSSADTDVVRVTVDPGVEIVLVATGPFTACGVVLG